MKWKNQICYFCMIFGVGSDSSKHEYSRANKAKVNWQIYSFLFGEILMSQIASTDTGQKLSHPSPRYRRNYANVMYCQKKFE